MKKAAIAATLTGVAVIGGALVGVVPAMAGTIGSAGVITIQGTCGQTFSPSVSGGSAGWTLSCSKGTIRAQGWVKDTDADGKAAEVYGTWEDGSNFGTVRAGGNGTVKKFDKSHAGSNVYLRLRVI
jgi:hypothetical protein